MNVWGEAILVQDDWTPYFSITHLLNSSSTKTFIYHIQCNISAENIGRKCHLFALFSFKIKSQYHSMIKIKSYPMDFPMENNSMLIMIVIKCNTMFFMCECVRSKGNLHLFLICKNKCTREKKILYIGYWFLRLDWTIIVLWFQQPLSKIFFHTPHLPLFFDLWTQCMKKIKSCAHITEQMLFRFDQTFHYLFGWKVIRQDFAHLSLVSFCLFFLFCGYFDIFSHAFSLMCIYTFY